MYLGGSTDADFGELGCPGISGVCDVAGSERGDEKMKQRASLRGAETGVHMNYM